MEKTGRNDPCVCGSGKKFKKCCERKMIGKRFMATKIDTQSPSIISSFFQKKIVGLNTSANSDSNLDSHKKINAQLNFNPQKDKISMNHLSNQENNQVSNQQIN
ncbi:MAG: SEC-C metal-binding domain-containing protein [Parachlamydiales bacterium]|jgi:hypothetical protein